MGIRIRCGQARTETSGGFSGSAIRDGIGSASTAEACARSIRRATDYLVTSTASSSGEDVRARLCGRREPTAGDGDVDRVRGAARRCELANVVPTCGGERKGRSVNDVIRLLLFMVLAADASGIVLAISKLLG